MIDLIDELLELRNQKNIDTILMDQFSSKLKEVQN